MAESPERGRQSEGAEQPRISGYRLEGVLGRGASGVVYRARQLSVDRPVALKVLHLSTTAKESTVKRLKREARLMAKLDHPNIVTAVDVGKSESGWWLAMELVEGRALSERLLRGGPLNEEEAIELFIPLCHALQHAHEAGVIHRDVKPANILLSLTGEPKLVDLGLARTEDEVQFTRLGATLGTPHYVSAEQARNPASVDARSDVYSLAATIHHAVCGAPPFPGESPAEVLANVLRAPLKSPREVNAGVSKGMDLVLRKALSRDPARRHASARELANDLRLIALGKRPRVQLGQLEALEGAGGAKGGVILGAAVLGLLTLLLVVNRAREPEVSLAVVERQSALEVLREEWAHDELTLAEALRMQAAMLPLASERESHAALGVELQRELESLLFKLRSEADEVRSALIRERRFEEARQVFSSGFAEGLFDASGFIFEGLPVGRLGVMERWRDRAELEIASAEARLHEESAQRLKRWCERELWPNAAAQARDGAFDGADALLGPELITQLENAGIDANGLELTQLMQSDVFTEAHAQHLERRFQLEQAWRELDERLLGLVKSRCAGAEARLREGEAAEISHEIRRWAEERFRVSGLSLNAMPLRFISRAAAELERSLIEMEGLESRIAEEREYELMQSLEQSSRALLLERRYAELVDWWSEQKGGASSGLLELIDLKVSEAQLLADFLEEARAAVIRGVKDGVTLQEVGLSIESAVRLDGDPVFEGFWVSIAPGSERSWRLGGSPEAKEGVKRVSRASLEQLAGRSKPSLAVAFLRLNEGDYIGADACFQTVDLRDAATRLGDELSARIGPLLAAELESSSERRAWAARWIQSNITERSSAVSDSKALRRVNAFLRDYGDSLDEGQRRKVFRWRDRLERASMPLTLDEFRESYEVDALSFPRRERVELTQFFDQEREGEWSAGEWIAVGAGWKAPRRAGIREMLESGAPTLILHDPVMIDRGVVEVELELSVPLDARARIVVVSAIGFHAAFLTGEDTSGRVCAGSRELDGVVERAIKGAGDDFQGFFPGETYRVTMQANSARGSLKVLIDGEECARIEDLSPKGRARSTSISVRSLEPLLLLSARIEAGRR